MKISIDQHNCCTAQNCKFDKICAQHGSAGDFRAEDGLRPNIVRINGEFHCETAEKEYDFIHKEVTAMGMMDLKDAPEKVTFNI